MQQEYMTYILSLPTVSFQLVAVGEQAKIAYGDLNGSDSVGLIDYSLIKQYMLGSITKLPSWDGVISTDVNVKGAIQSTDFPVMK
jgi:endo-1,4-beta-xylanase